MSELSADWGPSAVERTLTRVPNGSREAVVASQPAAFQPVIDLREDASHEAIARKAPKSSGLRLRLLTGDIVAVTGSWLILGTMNLPAASTPRRWLAALAAAVISVAFLHVLGLYRTRLCVQPGQQAARVALAVLAGALTLELLRRDAERSYGAVIAAAGFCVFAVIALRWIYAQWLRAQRARGRYLRGLVMIGGNEDAAAVWTMLDSEPELGYEVRAVIGRLRRNSDWAGLPNSRSIENLPEIAEQTGASGVLVVANALSAAEVHRVIELATASGLHVQVWPGFRGLGTRRVRQFPMSGETFFYVEPERHSAWQSAAKRTIDVVGASFGLLVSLPVLFLAWVVVRLEDGGPALYKQVRIGFDRRPFVVYKLRTMALGADDADLAMINERTDGPLFKAVDDPRVTRVGAFLRATSIDEIPQLFNVLTGKMSLVGPRPALPQEVAQFDRELQRRHLVKPGVTGLWQLEARDNPSFHAYRRLDLFYVDNWSNTMDLFILLATVPMVITRALGVGRGDRTARQTQSEAG